jgi:type I restriction enzyme S subunit
MISVSYLKKLLNDVESIAKPLGEVAEIKRGTSITQLNVTPGDIPVIAGGRKPAYFHNVSNRTGQTIVIAGSGAYAGFVSWWEQPIFVSDAFTVNTHSTLLPKYCFHWLKGIQQQLHELKSGGGVPHVYPRDVAPLQIPIPCPENPEKSLEIQTEIVRILDAFTELTAELTTELTARKKQYNYYRNKLLSFEDGVVEWKTLGSILTMRAGQHISASKISDIDSEGFVYPCFGGNGVRGYVKEKSHSGQYLLVGRQGALCGNVQRMKGDFYATEHAVVVTVNEDVNVDFAFHMLTLMNLNQYASQSAQPGLAVGKLEGLKMPIPSLVDQVRIAAILDKFDALTNSITEGLPREIELRQKQYEYYRNQILSFPTSEGLAA